MGAPELALTPARVAQRAASTAFLSLAALGRSRSLERRHGAEEADARRRAVAFHLLCREVCDIHGLDIALRGALPGRPAILVANHLSWLDPVVLAALLPVAPVAKMELDGWPLIGDVGRSHGVLFVRRGHVHSGARALLGGLGALAAGVSVLNFPEGTTTDGDRLLPFHRGVFGLARHAGVPIQPLALRFATPAAHWTGNASFLPHYLRTAALPRLRVEVRMGTPFHASHRDRPEQLAAVAAAQIEALLSTPGEH